MRSPRAALAAAVMAFACACLAPPSFAGGATKAGLQRQLDALVAAEGGPPGAIVTLRRGSRITTLSAGVADVETGIRSATGTNALRSAAQSRCAWWRAGNSS